MSENKRGEKLKKGELNVKQIAIYLANLPVKEQVAFVHLYAELLKRDNQTAERVKSAFLSSLHTGVFGKGARIEQYMETLFQRSPKSKPKKVAFETLYYYKFDPTMLPYLIKTAQRVKDRIRKRKRD